MAQWKERSFLSNQNNPNKFNKQHPNWYRSMKKRTFNKCFNRKKDYKRTPRYASLIQIQFTEDGRGIYFYKKMKRKK